MRIADIDGRNLVIVTDGKQFPTFGGAKLHESASVNIVDQAELVNDEKTAFFIFWKSAKVIMAFELEGRVNSFAKIA